MIQPQCPASFFVLVLQSCFGVFVQSLMTGLIFCKLARAKQRAHTIMFSRLAVVCKRDCEYQLLFRVGDMRRSHIVATSIRALMVKDRSPIRRIQSTPIYFSGPGDQSIVLILKMLFVILTFYFCISVCFCCERTEQLWSRYSSRFSVCLLCLLITSLDEMAFD